MTKPSNPRRNVARLATATLPAPVDPPNKRKPWTPDKDSDLQYDWFAGRTLTSIAQEYGRTEAAIVSRLVIIHAIEDWTVGRALADATVAQRVAASHEVTEAAA